MRKRRKKWRKNEEKTKKIKNEESKETIRKNWGITGENGEISVKMRKMGRKKWGKLGKFLFLKLRSGEICYFCAFFATLIQALAGFLGQKSKGFCSHIHTRIQTYRHTEIWTQMTESKVSERFSSACIKERSKSRFWTRTSLPRYTSQHDASANLRHCGSSPAHDYIFFSFSQCVSLFYFHTANCLFAIKTFIFW